MAYQIKSRAMRDDDPGHGQRSAQDSGAIMEYASGMAVAATRDEQSRPGDEWAEAEYRVVEETISLLDWNNERPIANLWIYGVSHPAGYRLQLNQKMSGVEEHCDSAKKDLPKRIWHLRGTVNENDTWDWDGEGNPTDLNKNAIYNIHASRR
jgi:hypothetical protein